MANEKTLATLKVDGCADHSVTDYSFSFNTAVDKDNLPVGSPRGGKLYVKVDAFVKEPNVDLLNWAMKKTAKNGSLEVMVSSEADKKLKDIKFEKAYCVDYKETWLDVSKKTSDDIQANYEELWIVWESFDAAGAKYGFARS